MMKKTKLTDAEVIALIESAEQSSYGINDSELSAERAQAIDFYLGKPFGNEVEGRSQVVSSDVADVVESLMPQLMKIFCSGDEVVRFNPRGPEDIEGAEQETDAINYIVMEQQAGFNTFYTWFKDALISKVGYVKCYWENKEEVETEAYNGLTDDELALLGWDPEVEIIEHTEYPDEIDAQQRHEAMQQMAMAAQHDQNAAKPLQQLQAMPPAMLHDVKVETRRERGEICIDPVPPEAMMVSINTRGVSLQDASFVQHREWMTIAEAEEQGYEVPDDVGHDDEGDSYNLEPQARDLYGEQAFRGNRGEDDRILVKDTYIRIDGELMRYVVIGKQVVVSEEAEVIPFAAITPIIMPHRHVGRSVADLVMDIQLIKSTLLRGQLDNIYLANSPRFGVSERVNLDDLIVSRPGGLVRVQGDPAGAIMPLQSPPLPPQSFSLVEYIDRVRDQRTGGNMQQVGVNPDLLNTTATQANIMQNGAQEHVALIARVFAETGVKELFVLVHRLTKKYSQRPMVMRLRNKWVTVDPRTWKTRYDMSISVGLGTGNKDQQLSHIMAILQAQKESMALGLANPQTIYNALAKMTSNAGFKNPEEFWVSPKDSKPMPPPPNPLLEVEKVKQQGKAQEVQANLQADQQKFQAEAHVQMQLEQLKADMKLQEIRANLELQAANDQRDFEREQQKAQMDAELEQQKIEFEKWKAQLAAETQIYIKQLELGAAQPTSLEDSDMNNALAVSIDGFRAAVEQMNRPQGI